MRIGLTSPFGHPFVRRGIERYCSDLAWWLTGRGHDVTWVCSAPDREEITARPDGVTMHYVRQGRTRGQGRLTVDPVLSCAVPIARAIRKSAFDVVEAHHPVDGAATRIASRGRVPYIQWFPGAPPGGRIGGKPLHRIALRTAVGGASRVHCLSAYAQQELSEGYGIHAAVFPPGVRTDAYQAEAPESSSAEPVVLCTADAADPRKRVATLIEAFAHLAARLPEVRLVLAPHRGEAARALIAALPASARQRAEVRAGLDFDDLAALYRAAAVSVLPSVREAFGLVLVESLAAGTPVVGSDHGAIPEVIDHDGIGRVAPPDDPAGLAQAIEQALELHEDPSTAERCRQHALRWDWSQVGPPIEAALLAVAERADPVV